MALSAAGDAVAVKRGSGAVATRLRHEATVLRLVAGPGVVELVSVDELPDGTVELATRYAGPSTLADATLAAPEVVAVLGAIASALSAAHAAGVSHGAVCAEHVIVGDGNTPVLCGWGTARSSTTGAAPGGADDVRDFGLLAGRLVGDAGDPVARRLRVLAANATVGDASQRPPMIAIAAALDTLATPPATERRRAWRPAGLRRSVAVIASVATVAAAATVALLVFDPAVRSPAGSHPGAPPTSPPVVSLTPRATTTTAASTPAAVRVWPREAPVVEHDGARWVVGEPGDRAFQVSWGCAPGGRLALVRPSTGAVYVFDEWPAAGATPAGRPVGRVEGASTLRAGDADGDGCGEIDVVRHDGEVVTVDPGP